jgi:hypothetical protein
MGKKKTKEDATYDAYEWYMTQKSPSQPLFTYAGWLKAGKPVPQKEDR